MRVLVYGGGAREHALWEKIHESPLVGSVICAPGNAGIRAEHRRAVRLDDMAGLVRLAKDERIDLAVIGPDALLQAGLADRLREAGILAFGPSAQAARIEWSKVFTKLRCREWGIPTADFEIATTPNDAAYIIKYRGFRVVKADGLCRGKGVIVADTEDETIAAARALFENGAGKVVLEDCLVGHELSVIVLTDGGSSQATAFGFSKTEYRQENLGKHIVFLPFTRDHKRLLDGDKGPNTGGMGAYGPVHIDEATLNRIKDEILVPTLRGMAARGTPFRGALYAGIMLTREGPKLIEYNARWGDPETQTLLPLIESDIVPYLWAACEKGGLAKMPPLKVKPCCTVSTVLVPRGYPGECETGFPIIGVGESDPHVRIHHAGTERIAGGMLVASGHGRTLCVTGLGDTFPEARKRSLDVAIAIARRSCGMLSHRTDIAEGVE